MRCTRAILIYYFFNNKFCFSKLYSSKESYHTFTKKETDKLKKILTRKESFSPHDYYCFWFLILLAKQTTSAGFFFSRKGIVIFLFAFAPKYSWKQKLKLRCYLLFFLCWSFWTYSHLFFTTSSILQIICLKL